MSKNHKPQTTNHKKGKRVLIVRLDKIGDVLLSTPAIKALKDAYPASHIAFMVRPYARDIVEGNPYVNEIITYDKAGGEKGFLKSVRFILNLRKNSWRRSRPITAGWIKSVSSSKSLLIGSRPRPLRRREHNQK